VTATIRSAHTHAAARKPRQMKMREALGGAKPAPTPPRIDLSPPSDPESEPPPAAASELRYPLSGATNKAERRTAQPAVTPPQHQPVSIFDLLSSGMGDAAVHDGGGSAASQGGSGHGLHPQPRAYAVTKEQASPWGCCTALVRPLQCAARASCPCRTCKRSACIYLVDLKTEPHHACRQELRPSSAPAKAPSAAKTSVSCRSVSAAAHQQCMIRMQMRTLACSPTSGDSSAVPRRCRRGPSCQVKSHHTLQMLTLLFDPALP